MLSGMRVTCKTSILLHLGLYEVPRPPVRPSKGVEEANVASEVETQDPWFLARSPIFRLHAKPCVNIIRFAWTLFWSFQPPFLLTFSGSPLFEMGAAPWGARLSAIY